MIYNLIKNLSTEILTVLLSINYKGAKSSVSVHFMAYTTTHTIKQFVKL